VIIVALLPGDGGPRLVLIREFRVPVGGYVYGLPAGLIDPGETLEGTVRREIREETGLEVAKILRVTPPLLSTAGMSDESAAMAFIEVTAPDGYRPRLEASEDIEALLVSREEAGRLCDDPSAQMDAKAWMAMHLFRLTGRIV
jgi:ADP-ribose pyrophosphatase